MEKRMKNRLALLGSLLLIGLTLAGIGSALGAGTVLQKPDLFLAEISDGSIVVSKNNEVIKTMPLPEGKQGITLGTSSAGIQIGYLSKEEMERAQAEREAELNKLIEIAKKDSRVQELIKDKNYKVVGSGLAGKTDKTAQKGAVTFEVDGKYYKVGVDVSNEKVTSIEEQKLGKVGDYIAIDMG